MEAFDRRFALLFPGQGAQFVGMGADLCRESPEAREVFERADEVLGLPLSRLCFEGPADELDDTSLAQPAIFTATYALWRAFVARFRHDIPRTGFVAGHSLGEFSALAVAGALRFEDGLRLVRRRGEAMRDSGARVPGGMAAILGLSEQAVSAVVAEAADDGGVWIANLNCPGQVVVAGEREALQRALDLALQRGAKRAWPLSVSVACHTPCMAAAADRLNETLQNTEIARPLAPVVCNATAQPTSDPAILRANLLRQLTSPVRWEESVRRMAEAGVLVTLELGPKAVVSALVRRIDARVAAYSVTSAAEIASFQSEVLVR